MELTYILPSNIVDGRIAFFWGQIGRSEQICYLGGLIDWPEQNWFFMRTASKQFFSSFANALWTCCGPNTLGQNFEYMSEHISQFPDLWKFHLASSLTESLQSEVLRYSKEQDAHRNINLKKVHSLIYKMQYVMRYMLSPLDALSFPNCKRSPWRREVAGITLEIGLSFCECALSRLLGLPIY